MSGQLTVVGGRAPVTRGKATKDLQKVEFVVAGLKAKHLYNILQVARTQPEPFMSVGPPLPQMHRCAPTTKVSSHIVQEPEATVSEPSAQGNKATAPDLTVQEFEGDISEQGTLPYLSPIP